VAPATAGRSDTGAAAPAGDKSGSDSEVARLKARNAELEGLLTDAIDRRQKTTTKLEQAEARAKQAEGKERQRAAEAAIAAQIPEANRTAAIDALYRLQADGKVDLSGEDREAVVKTAIEKLKAERASYFEAPSTVPRIPGVNSGGVTVQQVGVTDAKGNRLI
jgi:hypothetical protein